MPILIYSIIAAPRKKDNGNIHKVLSPEMGISHKNRQYFFYNPPNLCKIVNFYLQEGKDMDIIIDARRWKRFQ